MTKCGGDGFVRRVSKETNIMVGDDEMEFSCSRKGKTYLGLRKVGWLGRSTGPVTSDSAIKQ